MPIRFLSDQSIDNQLTIQGSAGSDPLLKLFNNNNGSGALIRFSDQSPTVLQTGGITFYHANGSSYGSGAAFTFTTSESTLSVLADGKLLFKEGLFIKPSSGTGGGTELISSTGAYKIPSIVNAGTDTDQFLVRDSSGNVDFRTGTQVRSDIGAGTGTMSSWTITADNAVSHGVTNSAVVDIAGGTNISTSQSSGTVTITNGITNNNQLTNGAGYITSASLPTVNNGTLTMTTSTGLDGGATFTANQAGNSTFAVTLDLTEISLGAGLDSSATGLSLDLSEFTDMTQTMVGSDEFIVLDSGAERKKAANEIGLSIFNNDAGFITSGSLPTVNNSTITVNPGTGISGGGSFTLNQGSNATITITNSSPDTGTPAILSNGSTPSLNSGISAAEVRSLIGAGTGSGSMSSWNLQGDSGGSTSITNGETVDIAGGTNISTSRSSNTITITNGITNNNQLTNGAGYITSASLPSVGNGTITMVAGTGLTGGGTFTTNQSGNTSITFNASGSGTMSNWKLTADSGGTATIDNGETVDIIGGTNITTARSGNNVTINNGITNNNQLSNGAGYTTNTGTVTQVSTGTGLDGSISTSGTITLDLSELTDMTQTMTGSDEFIVLDSGAERRKAASEIGLSIFNNDAGYVTSSGVTSVATGNSNTLSKSGTTSVTLTPNTAAVANGGANLATGDQIYDFVSGWTFSAGGGDVSGSAALGQSVVLTLGTSGVTAGNYTNANISVDAKGRVTAASNGSSGSSCTVTSVATGNGISGGTITTSGTLTVGAGNGLSQSSTGLLMSGSYSGSFTVNGSTLSLTNSSGYAALEVGGTSGAFLDLKKPASDDYDIRLIHTTAGSNELTTASGALTINTGNSAAMHISTSDINLVGGKIKLESITSIDMQSSALKIGDVDGSDEVEQIDLITMANSNIVLQDQLIKLQSDDVTFNTTSTQNINYGRNTRNDLPGDMSGSGYQGDVLTNISQSTTAGKLYYKTTTGWALADADSSTTTYLLAIATGTNASSGMLLRGFFYKAGHGFTVGRPLYVGTSAGNLQQSAPTGTSDYARVVGYPTSSDTIFFNPDNTWVRVS